MGCTETKSKDEDYDEERQNPWITGHRRNDYQEEGYEEDRPSQRRTRGHQNYQEDEEESNNDEEEFKDFEEVGSK